MTNARSLVTLICACVLGLGCGSKDSEDSGFVCPPNMVCGPTDADADADVDADADSDADTDADTDTDIEPSPCRLQGEILEDCASLPVTDIVDYEEMCEAALTGDCDPPDCIESYSGGDVEECMIALLSWNEEAAATECTTDFAQGWCTTYYDTNDCAPFLFLNITCS